MPTDRSRVRGGQRHYDVVIPARCRTNRLNTDIRQALDAAPRAIRCWRSDEGPELCVTCVTCVTQKEILRV